MILSKIESFGGYIKIQYKNDNFFLFASKNNNRIILHQHFDNKMFPDPFDNKNNEKIINNILKIYSEKTCPLFENFGNISDYFVKLLNNVNLLHHFSSQSFNSQSLFFITTNKKTTKQFLMELISKLVYISFMDVYENENINIFCQDIYFKYIIYIDLHTIIHDYKVINQKGTMNRSTIIPEDITKNINYLYINGLNYNNFNDVFKNDKIKKKIDDLIISEYKFKNK